MFSLCVGRNVGCLQGHDAHDHAHTHGHGHGHAHDEALDYSSAERARMHGNDAHTGKAKKASRVHNMAYPGSVNDQYKVARVLAESKCLTGAQCFP